MYASLQNTRGEKEEEQVENIFYYTDCLTINKMFTLFYKLCLPAIIYSIEGTKTNVNTSSVINLDYKTFKMVLTMSTHLLTWFKLCNCKMLPQTTSLCSYLYLVPWDHGLYVGLVWFGLEKEFRLCA